MNLGLEEKYLELCHCIMRPPRDRYQEGDLGDKQFPMGGRWYTRTDKRLCNERGMSLVCSHYEPNERSQEKLPCVIFLHGNSSSRVEVNSVLYALLPRELTVFSLDFAGSGKSDGEFVSLGHFERDDVRAVVDHLQETGRVSSVGLWGRSMGAVTALLHASRDAERVDALVCDSAFSDLQTLSIELSEKFIPAWQPPGWLLRWLLGFMRNTILEKGGYDIYEIAPIRVIETCSMPALFVHAKGDTFIQPHHTDQIFDAYTGEKEKQLVEGDHNSKRPEQCVALAAEFLAERLSRAAEARSVAAARGSSPVGHVSEARKCQDRSRKLAREKSNSHSPARRRHDSSPQKLRADRARVDHSPGKQRGSSKTCTKSHDAKEQENPFLLSPPRASPLKSKCVQNPFLLSPEKKLTDPTATDILMSTPSRARRPDTCTPLSGGKVLSL